MIIVFLVGCFAFLTSSHGAIVSELNSADPNYNITLLTNLGNVYNIAGDGNGGQPESTIRAAAAGNAENVQTGQYAWGNNVPNRIVFSFDADLMRLSLKAGPEGNEQMVLSVPIRDDIYFNAFYVNLFINRGLSPQGSIKLDITMINGVPFDTHLGASYPLVSGEKAITGFGWDFSHEEPVKSFDMEGILVFKNGDSYHSSLRLGLAEVTIANTVPEPSSVGLIAFGATVLASLRRRKQ